MYDNELTFQSLPPEHPYIRMELEEMAEQLENEVFTRSECWTTNALTKAASNSWRSGLLGLAT